MAIIASGIKIFKGGELVPLPKDLFSQKLLPGVCYFSQQAIDDYGEEFLKEISETWSADSGEYRYHGKKVDAVLIDEAQFLSPEEVDTLSDIVDFYGIPVLCYGLRADFQTHLFPGSRRLMEIADIIEEVPTVCWCGRRAQCNTRYADGKIVREGAQIFLGSNESYVALCRKHYKEGKLWKEDE